MVIGLRNLSSYLVDVPPPFRSRSLDQFEIVWCEKDSGDETLQLARAFPLLIMKVEALAVLETDHDLIVAKTVLNLRDEMGPVMTPMHASVLCIRWPIIGVSTSETVLPMNIQD